MQQSLFSDNFVQKAEMRKPNAGKKSKARTPRAIAQNSSLDSSMDTTAPKKQTTRADKPAWPQELGVHDYVLLIDSLALQAKEIKVIGEISRINHHPTGVYMTLKDKIENTVLQCYINPYVYRGLGIALEEGLEVKVRGIASIVKRRGDLSLKIEELELSGEGSIKKNYELLKAKLENAGYFDKQRELPKFINSIGIITSKTGAVIDDFKNNLEKLGMKTYLIDVRVEGDKAAGLISNAIQNFNINYPYLDCIVVMRGGGSLEDLQAFNNEEVVKQIFASKLRVIAAIGHDRDLPLACLAADAFTSTPTAAAVLINKTWDDLKFGLNEISSNLAYKMTAKLSFSQRILITAAKNLAHKSEIASNVIGHSKAILENKINLSLQKIASYQNTTRTFESKAMSATQFTIQSARAKINSTEQILDSKNPLKILSSGYSLLRNNNGKIIKRVEQIKAGDKLELILSNGSASATAD